MHFAKWIRKNSKKIMVFVVIFSMVSFVIGYTGLQLFFSFFGGDTQLIGKFEGGKIRVREYRVAQNELQLLRMIGADRLLLAQGNQGLGGPLMAHLLFPDSPFVSDLASQLKQGAQSGQLPVSVAKIEEFFEDRTQPEVAWILLKAEANKAGCLISDAMARQLLQQILPQLAQGADAGQMINALIAQAHITEEQLYRTFAELLGVMFYAGNITDSQAVTLNQVQAAIGRSQERFDAEFVKIPAAWYLDADSTISQAELEKQFQTYKNVQPGQYSDDNPFGFGYKLPKRVRLEFMAVLLDDVKAQTERPTAENMEDFYSRNLERFRYEEPVDPNTPDGEKVTKTRTFAESLPQIRSYLEQERITRLANQIFNDAKTATEAGFSSINFEEADLAQLQTAAGDYLKTATELSGRYKVSVLTGQTGSLSAEDFGQDSILRSLRLQQGTSTIPLSEVAFAAQLDPRTTRRQIGVPTVRPWENIGPMIGGFSDAAAGQYHRLMAMVRIVGIEEEAVPAAVEISYSVKGMIILPAQQQDQEAVFSLTEKVADDIRLIKAMETARARAQSLAALVKERGWDEGLAAFNAENASDEKVSKAALETVRQQARMSKAETERMTQYLKANPVSAGFLQTRLQTSDLNNRLYALLPNDRQSTETIFEVLDVKTTEACYIVKNVNRLPATEADYLDNKVMTSLQLNSTDSAALSLHHLKPNNLFDRMKYAANQMPIVDARQPILPTDEGL